PEPDFPSTTRFSPSKSCNDRFRNTFKSAKPLLRLLISITLRGIFSFLVVTVSVFTMFQFFQAIKAYQLSALQLNRQLSPKAMKVQPPSWLLCLRSLCRARLCNPCNNLQNRLPRQKRRF